MKTVQERLEIAENLTDKINSEVSYASGRFTARAWGGGEKVRVYWCNGYAEIRKDGTVDTSPLKRSQKQDMDELLKK